MSIYRTSQQEQTRRASREAAEWLRVMNADPDADTREAFTAWVAASPLHIREMMLIGMLDRELAGSKVLDQFDLDSVLAAAKTDNNVVALPDRGPERNRSGRRHGAGKRASRWVRAAAVAAVLLLGVASWVGVRQFADSGVQYATAIGQHRTITLDDGTRVLMAPDSRISVELSSGKRIVRLQQGEARFDVVHDAARPFRVYADTSMIQDVGTQFSVNRLPSGIVVSVTEGRVSVTSGHLDALDNGFGSWLESWMPGSSAAIERPGVKAVPMNQPISLGAGEKAHISRGGGMMTRGKAGRANGVPVNARRLIFHDDTLADIAAEFNRYNPRQIIVEGDRVRLQRYSGVFDANDAASFLQFLDCCSSLKVSRNGHSVVISKPASVRPE